MTFKMTLMTLAIAALCASCAHDHDHGSHEGGSHSHGHDEDGHAHDEDALDHTECTGEEPAFTAGMERTGENGHVTVQLLATDPNPLAVGANTLTVKVLGSDATPLSGVTFADTTNTYQGIHGHAGGSNGTATATPGDEDGVYVVSGMGVIHPGSWDFIFDLEHQGTADRVTFTFCVAAEDAQ